MPEAWDPIEEQEAHDRLQAALFGRASPAPALARYRLGRKLGEGGNGVVYAAHDPELDRAVAVKLVRVRQSTADEDDIARLEREARALARLSHPNVLAIYDVGRFAVQDTEGVFVVTELIQGQTLRDWLATPRPWPVVLDKLLEAAAGLAAAHDAGLVHRDFKPANVMVGDDDRIRVLDFGLARRVTELPSKPSQGTKRAPESDGAVDDSPVIVDSEERVTRTGLTVGTPAYMAPEQLAGQPASSHTDQYSFCVTAFEALQGRRPFESAADYDARQVTVSRRDVPRSLASAIARGLAEQPSERFADMAMLRRAMLRARRRQWPWLLAGVGLAVAVTSLVTSLVAQPRSSNPPQTRGACAADFADIWNPEAAAAVRAAFVATGAPNAQLAARIVDSAVDDFAVAFESVAAAQRQEGAADRAAAMCECLLGTQNKAAAILDSWAAATPERVAVAVHEVGALGNPDECRAPRPLPPSPIPDQERRVLLERLWQAQAIHYGGDPVAAAPVAQQLLSEVSKAGDRWLAADIGSFLAEVHMRTGDYEAAKRVRVASYEDAVAAGNEEVAVSSSVLLVELVGGALNQPEAGLQWVRHAEAAIERAAAPSWAGVLAKAQAVVHSRNGDPKAALPFARRGCELLAESLGPEHPRAALARAQLGNIYVALGRLQEGKAALEEAAEVLKKLYGLAHPMVLPLMSNLALVAQQLGDTLEAERRQRELIELTESTFGARHETLPFMVLTLAEILREREPEEALTLAERAVELHDATQGPDSADTAYALWALGLVATELDPDRATEALRRSLDITERTAGADHPKVLLPLSSLFEIAVVRGDDDEADQLAKRAARLCPPALSGEEFLEACAIFKGSP